MTIEHFTKDNKLVKLTRIEEYDSPRSAWIVHMILAEVKNEFAGYLKISYIPEDRFNKHYPDILHFLANKKGWSSLKKALETKDLDLIISEIDVYNEYTKPILEMELQLIAIQDLTKKLQVVYNEEYNGFKEYHMNRPQIDMVRVYNEHDYNAFGHNPRESILRQNRLDFKNKGIGRILYNEAVTWMAEKNLCLYASGSQTEDAQRMWSKLNEVSAIKEFVPSTTNKEYGQPRKYLDYRNLNVGFEPVI